MPKYSRTMKHLGQQEHAALGPAGAVGRSCMPKYSRDVLLCVQQGKAASATSRLTLPLDPTKAEHTLRAVLISSMLPVTHERGAAFHIQQENAASAA